MKTATPLVAVCILATDYEAMRRLVPDDERLPARYEDWTRRANERIARLIKRAEKFIAVVVKPDDLITHCRATGEKPSWAMLEAVAVQKAGK